MVLCAPLPGVSVPPGLLLPVSANNSMSALPECYLATHPGEDEARTLRPRGGRGSPLTRRFANMPGVAAAEVN